MQAEVKKLRESGAQSRIKMEEKHEQILDETFKRDEESKKDSPDKEGE